MSTGAQGEVGGREIGQTGVQAGMGQMRPPLLPDRHPTADFFICDVLDAIPKDDMASMEHPIFSLSTRPDRRILTYASYCFFLTSTRQSRGLAARPSTPPAGHSPLLKRCLRNQSRRCHDSGAPKTGGEGKQAAQNRQPKIGGAGKQAAQNMRRGKTGGPSTTSAHGLLRHVRLPK